MKIDNQYTIHIAEDTEEELKAITSLNLIVHQEELLETYIRRVFLEHPRKKEILWFYIKDNYENKLVSSICLLPLDWQIKDIKLPVCEMEFVGTLKGYRGQNLIKKLNALYEKVMVQKGYVLSVIRGIPYYYRSLGYEYVSSLDERISVPVSKIPQSKYNNIKIRKANPNDLHFIQSRYNQFYKSFYIFNTFDSSCFKFKYMNEQFNAEVRSTYIIEEAGELKNYFSLGLSYDHEYYELMCPDLTKEQMIIVLQFMKTIGNYSEDDIITLSISEVSLLYDYVNALGGSPISTYGWQVKIPDMKIFFLIMKKIIEDRLKRSVFNGLTKTVRISNYQETIELNFSNGMLDSINIEKGYPDLQNIDLRIPGALLSKFLLGDRTIDEIRFIIKDAIVNSSSKSLIETIFPKQISFFSSTI